MKNATACAKKLTALMKKLPAPSVTTWPEADDPVAVLIQSFLLADATTEQAMAGYGRLREHVVDFNDLRVSMPDEVAAHLGARYPQGWERCRRLRAALKGIYLREHSVRLDSLKDLGKREVKKYLETLEGMTTYTTARLLLFSFKAHAIPVDDQLLEHLAAAGAVDDGATTAEVASWLARQIKVSDGMTAHLQLEAWAEAQAAKKPAASKKPAAGKKTTTKKTRKKKTTSKKTVAKRSTKKTVSKKSTGRAKTTKKARA